MRRHDLGLKDLECLPASEVNDGLELSRNNFRDTVVDQVLCKSSRLAE